MQYLKLLNIIIPIIILISLGYLAKRLGLVKAKHATFLNNIIIYVTLPALIFSAIYQAELSISFLKIPLVALLTMAVITLAVFLIFRKAALGSTIFGSLLLVVAVGNTGYLGYPLALEISGKGGLVKAIFYDVFGTVIFILTVGLFIAEYYGTESKKINKIKELLTFPALIALFLGLIFKSVSLPSFIVTIFSFLGMLTIILIMISIGLSLELSKIRGYIWLFGLVALVKLIISPFLAWEISYLLSVKGQAMAISVLQASMPPAMLSLVFGIKYKLDAAFLSSAIFLTTILSVVTIPLFQLLVR